MHFLVFRQIFDRVDENSRPSSRKMTENPLRDKILRLTVRSLKASGAVLLILTLALLAGALIPRNRGFVSPSEGVRIWVLAGSIHTDLIVPVRNELFDWSDLVSRDDVRLDDPSLDHLGIGWGNRTFYLETRTWGQVKAQNVAAAFFGLGTSAMHVEWFPGGWETSSNCRSLVLSGPQYARLCSFMKESFVLDARGRARRIEAPGYGDSDAFYEANGRYSAYRTCNTWTGDALAYAGVRVGLWTPTPGGVLRQLPPPPETSP